ncbi:MAG: hypothetical protein ACJ79M_01740, partial [Myxococcales bacterium]
MTRDRAASATGPPPAPAPQTAFSRPRLGEQPPYLYEPYASTIKRAPRKPPVPLPHTLSEMTGPAFARGWAGSPLTDLTRPGKGEALGQRIIVAGRLLD